MLLLTLLACKDKSDSQKPVDPALGPSKSGGDDVRPAFEGSPKKIDPAASALCAALHQAPAEKKASCCRSAPAIHFGSECTRVLSLALEQKTVTLKPTEACLTALSASYDGCDWVGPNEVRRPDTCAGLVVGQLELGKKCRSTLECAGGTRCFGAGPTAAGICAIPGGEGLACELSVDVLATYARQPIAPHLECAGFCQRHRCETVLLDAGACSLDDQCPMGQRCAGTCVSGVLGERGQKCVPGGCATGLRCIAGSCGVPGAAGAFCSSDAECAGACRPTDAGRRCGPGC